MTSGPVGDRASSQGTRRMTKRMKKSHEDHPTKTNALPWPFFERTQGALVDPGDRRRYRQRVLQLPVDLLSVDLDAPRQPPRPRGDSPKLHFPKGQLLDQRAELLRPRVGREPRPRLHERLRSPRARLKTKLPRGAERGRGPKRRPRKRSKRERRGV